MSKMSISFTLGKASSPHGANIAHNNREIIAGNVDVNRICDNITYVQQDIREAYDELFADSVAEYNAKQKQPCRRISDYYEHIETGNREDPFYELIIQFGSVKDASVGSPNGEIAKKMLDEYMSEFQKRNKNLHVFGATMHLDEASPHIHIDFIPFYTQGRKIGLSKGVSMKSALIEQGFSPKGRNKNQLVLWEESERKIMSHILSRHGFNRDIKNATYDHMTDSEYKQMKDSGRFDSLARRNLSPQQITAAHVQKIESENSLLKVQNNKLVSEKSSPWKSFFYSDSSKQLFVQRQLDNMNISYRETENGFEAQEDNVKYIT